MNNKKIVFIYAGANRIAYFKEYLRGIVPDTALFGFNYIKNNNFKADVADISNDFSFKFEQIFRKLFGFNQVFLLYFFKIFKYDYIFSSVALNLLFFKGLFGRPNNKWIVFNIHLTNLLKRSSRGKQKFISWILNKFSYKIICLSTWQKKFLISIGIPENKLSVVCFGTDKNFFYPTHENGDYILSVGRDNGRDYKTLIEAFKGSDIKVKIVCSKRNINNIIDLPKNIEIFYNLDYLTIRKLYQGARLVIVPSRNEDFYFDGSDCSGQMTILDAMACGKPVIASYRKWMDDYFVDNKDIFMVEPENCEILRSKFLSVFDNIEELNRIGSAARKLIEKRLNSEVMANSILETLK